MKNEELRQKHRGVEAEIRAVRCDGGMVHAYDMPHYSTLTTELRDCTCPEQRLVEHILMTLLWIGPIGHFF